MRNSKMEKKRNKRQFEIVNRRVHYNYYVEEVLECGISLKGNEIKSIRVGMVNLNDSYIEVKEGELNLLNCHITKWDTANDFDVSEKRPRKLLAHKTEIIKLAQKTAEQGYTIMPLRIYFNEAGKCKVLIGLCKGKHIYDKRNVEKEKQVKRDIERMIKG